MPDLQNVIAYRELLLHGGGVVTIYVDAPTKEGDDYMCQYKIVGMGDGKNRHVYGVDPIQSIILALKKIGTELYTSYEWKNGQLSWNCGSVSRDLGFPVPDIIRDIPPCLP